MADNTSMRNPWTDQEREETRRLIEPMRINLERNIRRCQLALRTRGYSPARVQELDQYERALERLPEFE